MIGCVLLTMMVILALFALLILRRAWRVTFNTRQ